MVCRTAELRASWRCAARITARDVATERVWWRCRCGRRLYEHSRRRVPNAGTFEYTCGRTASGRYESETLPERGFDCDKGVVTFTTAPPREPEPVARVAELTAAP